LPCRSLLAAARKDVEAIDTLVGAPDERVRRTLRGAAASVIGANTTATSANKAAVGGGGSSVDGATSSGIGVDTTSLGWILHRQGHTAVCRLASFEALLVALVAADRHRSVTVAGAAAAVEDESGDAMGGGGWG